MRQIDTVTPHLSMTPQASMAFDESSPKAVPTHARTRQNPRIKLNPTIQATQLRLPPLLLPRNVHTRAHLEEQDSLTCQAQQVHGHLGPGLEATAKAAIAGVLQRRGAHLPQALEVEEARTQVPRLHTHAHRAVLKSQLCHAAWGGGKKVQSLLLTSMQVFHEVVLNCVLLQTVLTG